MYFNAETQVRILGRFHFALRDSGYLFLGKAETLMAQGQLFAPVDLKRRIFRSGRAAHRATACRIGQGPVTGATMPRSDAHLQRAASSRSARWPRWSSTPDGRVGTHQPSGARSLFGLAMSRHRPAAPDLELSYRPVELRVGSSSRRRSSTRRSRVKDIEWRGHTGEVRWLDLDGHARPGAATSPMLGVP